MKSAIAIDSTEKPEPSKEAPKISEDDSKQSKSDSTTTSQKPKPVETNLSNDRKRVNSKPKWSRFEEDFKSSSQKRRTDRGSDRYDDRPIRRGTGTGTGGSTSSSSSRYNSIRSSRSSQVSSKNAVNSRGRRNENGYHSTQKSAQTNGDHKDTKTAKQLTGRPVIIDPMVAAPHFYGTYYFNNPTTYPLDAGVGSLKESIKRQM